MATPTWDNTFTWDVSNWDADSATALTPDPNRTIKITGQVKRCEFEKDPDSRLDYTFDWSGWLVSDDSIATGVITTPPGTTLMVTGLQPTPSRVTFWVEGGAEIPESTPAKVQCRITTAKGRIDDRTLYLRIQEL